MVMISTDKEAPWCAQQWQLLIKIPKTPTGIDNKSQEFLIDVASTMQHHRRLVRNEPELKSKIPLKVQKLSLIQGLQVQKQTTTKETEENGKG